MLVKESMVKKIITIESDDNVLKAFSIMMKRGIRHLPVMNDKKLVGIISDKDIRQSLVPWKGTNFDKDLLIETHKTSVAEIMTIEVHTVTQDTSIEEAAHNLTMFKIGCLPVVNKTGKVVGMITKSIIIEIFISIMELLQKSSRIDVVIKDGQKALKIVEKIIEKNGGQIICIGTSPSRKKNSHVHFFRMERCNTDTIVSEIKKARYKVISAV